MVRSGESDGVASGVKLERSIVGAREPVRNVCEDSDGPHAASGLRSTPLLSRGLAAIVQTMSATLRWNSSRAANRLAHVALAGLATLAVSGLAGCVSAPVADSGTEPVATVHASTSPESDSPLSAEVLYRLLVAEFAGRRGEIPLALENYLAVVRQTGDAAAAERAVRIAMFARDLPRGLEAVELWLEIAPQSIDAKQVHAVLLIRNNDADGAVAVLESLVEQLDRESPGDGLRAVGEILAREKNHDVAIAVMERLVEDRPQDAGAQFALGHLLARSKQFDRAREVFERAIVLHARILQQQGDISQALSVLSDRLEAHPKADTVRLTYARLLVEAKRFDEARDEFLRLSADDPDNEDVSYALALLLLQTNHLASAEEQFRKLVGSVQRRYAAYYYLGQIAENRDDVEQALAAYRHVDRGDHRLNANLRIAVLLAEVDRVAEARAHLHGLRGSNLREAIRIYRAEAEILMRLERFEEAMEVYDLSLNEFPQDTDLLYARAMLAEKLDRIALLESDLTNILSREPNNADALNALGYTLADRTDRLDEAYVLIKRAFDLKPDDHYVVDSLGWVLYRMGRHQEAVAQLRRAMEINPDPEIAAHLGEVLWAMGNRDEARTVWETALQTTPDDKRLLDVKKRFGL